MLHFPIKAQDYLILLFIILSNRTLKSIKREYPKKLIHLQNGSSPDIHSTLVTVVKVGTVVTVVTTLEVVEILRAVTVGTLETVVTKGTIVTLVTVLEVVSAVTVMAFVTV